MKNSILILTIIFLSGLLSFSSFTIVKQNKELKFLQSKLSEQEQSMTKLKQEKEFLTPKAEIHPIEKAGMHEKRRLHNSRNVKMCR